jgi:hypothetical protein
MDDRRKFVFRTVFESTFFKYTRQENRPMNPNKTGSQSRLERQPRSLSGALKLRIRPYFGCATTRR